MARGKLLQDFVSFIYLATIKETNMAEKIFNYMSNYGYEKVLLFQNRDLGLRVVQAIHGAILT